MDMGSNQVKKLCKHIITKLLPAFFLILIFSLSAFAFDDPVSIKYSYSNSIYSGKPIVRTSSGRIYYFIGDVGHTGQWDGWIEAHTSLNGSSWSKVSSEDQWHSSTNFSVAIDSKNVVHMMAFDWTYRPYYKKFNTADSPKADHSWEGYELLETLSNSSSSVRCVMAVDGNDAPHGIYPSYVKLKGKKSYFTLIYANKVDGTWHKTDIWPLANPNSYTEFNIAIGPDNLPYILLGTKMLKGNANNPSSFEVVDLGIEGNSFVIHQNGDVRVALSSNGNYANYLHDHTQQWNTGWSLQVSSTPYNRGVLILSKDVPYMVKVLGEGLVVQKQFDPPLLLVSKSSTEYWGPIPSTRWSFYNNSTGPIDLGFEVSYGSNTIGKYFLYTKYQDSAYAAFSADLTSGLGPLVVNFTDMSSVPIGETILTWGWDFNNDGIMDSNLQDPNAIYTEEGKYTVSLIIADSGGNVDTLVKTDYIEVLPDTSTTKADFLADPTSGLGPLVVNFTDMSSVHIGETISTWAWDFNNDGIIDSNLQDPNAIYTEEGKYTVSLTIADSGGNIDTETKEDYIEVMTGTDADSDGISDDLDNCPAVYNPKQRDLNGNGIGDACETSLDMFHQALYSTRIKKENGTEKNSQDITALMKDGLLAQGVRIQKSNQFDIVSFRSDVDAVKLSEFILNIHVSDIYGTFQQIRIYPYNADGLTVQNTALNGSIHAGWNKINLSSILHTMNGMGFIKFRVVAVQDWFDISEAYITELVDSWEINANPSNLDFGSLEVGGTLSLNFIISNQGAGELIINAISNPSIPFSITTDECSGATLSSFPTCTISVNFTPMSEGTFNDSLLVLSNDADNPSFKINLSGIATDPSAVITGTVTDYSIGTPLSGVAVTITDSIGSYLTTTAVNGTYTVSGLAEGIYTATFSKSGYIVQTLSGSISLGQTLIFNIQLSPIPPLSIEIISPQNGAVVNSSTITVTGNASDYENINITVNGVQALLSDYVFSAEINLIEGQNTITAIATDQYEQTALQSITVTYINPTPPVISNITLTDITTDSAVITWTTDQPSDSLVEYGETTAYGSIVSDTGLATTHSISLSNLSPDTTYHFKVTSKNANDFSSSSGDQTFTTLIPPPPVISNIVSSNITTNSVTISWTTDQPTSSQVEYGTTDTYGSSISDPALATDHSIQIQNLNSGTAYHFKISSTNAYGSSSSSQDNTFTTLSPITITITSPSNNETINRPDVMVKGTITNTTGNETGIIVNGMPANVYSNQFIVNSLPLTEGMNPITVTATDTDGNTLSESLSVNAITTGNYIRVISNIESGISPLQVSLRIDGSFSITASDISVTGPGSVEFLPGTLVDEYEVIMTTEGVYYFTVTVTGPDNIVYEDTVAITVLNKTQLDTLLKGKWEGMKGALMSGDIETALTYFVERGTERYRQAFITIGNSTINSIFSSITELRLNNIYVPVAQYWALRTESNGTFAYPITFGQDLNGIWKIMGF